MCCSLVRLLFGWGGGLGGLGWALFVCRLVRLFPWAVWGAHVGEVTLTSSGLGAGSVCLFVCLFAGSFGLSGVLTLAKERWLL